VEHGLRRLKASIPVSNRKVEVEEKRPRLRWVKNFAWHVIFLSKILTNFSISIYNIDERKRGQYVGMLK
jgi:hypothetical protein